MKLEEITLRSKWINSSETIQLLTAVIEEGSVLDLDTYAEHLNKLPLSSWSILYKNKIIAKSSGETKDGSNVLKEQARELYAEHQNYAKVAKLIGIHPTTVRTWLN